MAKLTAYGALIRNKLVAFGIPADVAERILVDQRIAHQWGPKKRDIEYLSLGLFRDKLKFLELAEHIARVFHNWEHCYTVDTSRLAMLHLLCPACAAPVIPSMETCERCEARAA